MLLLKQQCLNFGKEFALRVTHFLAPGRSTVGCTWAWMTKSVLLLLMHPTLHVTQCGDWLSLFGVTINAE